MEILLMSIEKETHEAEIAKHQMQKEEEGAIIHI